MSTATDLEQMMDYGWSVTMMRGNDPDNFYLARAAKVYDGKQIGCEVAGATVEQLVSRLTDEMWAYPRGGQPCQP